MKKRQKAAERAEKTESFYQKHQASAIGWEMTLSFWKIFLFDLHDLDM